jgi:PAS domain S-box-containing protein
MNELTNGELVFPLIDGGTLTRCWLDGGMAILDSLRQIVAVNQSLAQWLGASAGSLRGREFVEILSTRFPEWEGPLQEMWQNSAPFAQRHLSTGSVESKQWFSLELAGNETGYFVRLNSVLPPLQELAETAWDEHLRSESARRHMFVRLMRAEAQLDNLVHRWPGVIFSQRADFTFQFVSPRIEELTGVPVEAWGRQPQKFWQVVHEADVDELKRQIKRAACASQGVTSTYRIRHTQTGQVFYLMEHRQGVLSNNGLLLGYEGVWLDVTRQTIAEKRLSTAAWKETLGMLTMGLAHDFSNIMAGIHSLSESFLAQVDAQHPFHEGLTLIRQHSLQANQLVQRITQLHHGKTGERNYYDLNEIVKDAVDLARKILPRRVTVSTELETMALPLYVDVVEFRQVILNLTLNAADAMPQGGKLAFRTSLQRQLPELAHMEGAMPRLPSVRLAVQDTGCGIPARHLASIFDPFFTTKAMNKGSGLGLYNARLFVEKHHGGISVDSVEAVGTTFAIWLPQADFTEGERVQVSATGQRRSLLLVGQDGEVLDSTAEFLRMHGYHVVTVHTGEQATESLRSPEYQFVGLYLLVEAGNRELSSLIPDLRRHRPCLKTVLQIVGCNQDELDSHALARSDLILTSGLPEKEILHRLKVLFDQDDFDV